MPYPPNFKRIPARIIDPATGASTWALGSHRWTKYSGIFTINAMRDRNHQIDHEIVRGGRMGVMNERLMDRCPQDVYIQVKFIRRGRLAQTV